MKKTLTINLSDIVFNIDEDAYEILNEYLRKLEVQFSDEDGKEVMRDIEARLAELFGNILKSGNKNVVTINDVNSVIEQLGTAEEIGGENKNFTFDDKETDKESRKRYRKFYRDADNKILGGVAAGLAAYLGLETTITRLILLLLAITVLGWLIPIYLLVWLIAPEATTTAQKLEMQGIEPSIENIKNYLNSEQLRESASRIGSRLGEVVKWLFRIAAIIVGLFFAFIGVIIIGALTIALIGIITAGTSAVVFGDILPIGNSNATIVTFIISTLIAILIPIISIILATIRLIRRDNTPRKSGWGWMWFVIWIIATIVSISTLLQSIPKAVDSLNNLEENGLLAILDENTTTEERLRNTQFNEIEIDDALVVQLIEDTCCFVEVRGTTTALRNIKTYVEENTLNIELQKGITLSNKHSVSIHYCSEIKKIEIGSASVVSTESNRIKSNDLEIDASSASVINLGVACNNLDIDASSAAVINIWGETEILTAELLPTAIANLKDLSAKNANIEASTGTVVELPKTENINLNQATGAIIK